MSNLHRRFAVGVAIAASIKESKGVGLAARYGKRYHVFVLYFFYLRCGVLLNSGQNSADLAQGSFIFKELNFCRSYVL